MRILFNPRIVSRLPIITSKITDEMFYKELLILMYECYQKTFNVELIANQLYAEKVALYRAGHFSRAVFLNGIAIPSYHKDERLEDRLSFEVYDPYGDKEGTEYLYNTEHPWYTTYKTLIRFMVETLAYFSEEEYEDFYNNRIALSKKDCEIVKNVLDSN